MILLFDLGNTASKVTIQEQGKITQKIILERNNELHDIEKLLEHYKPTHSILCSVIHHSKEIEELLKQKTKFISLSHYLKLPFLNAYTTPETLGQDRVALLAALSVHYPMQNSIVISVGTCITYSFLASNNAFRGGAISPGIQMRLDALHQYTQQLPHIKKEGDIVLVGYDTETSIRSGVINGIAAEIEGMIEKYTRQYGKINAVLTGGDVSYFETRMKKEIFVDSNFLFKGLYAIFQKNQ